MLFFYYTPQLRLKKPLKKEYHFKQAQNKKIYYILWENVEKGEEKSGQVMKLRQGYFPGQPAPEKQHWTKDLVLYRCKIQILVLFKCDVVHN